MTSECVRRSDRVARRILASLAAVMVAGAIPLTHAASANPSAATQAQPASPAPGPAKPAAPATLTKFERERGRMILNIVRADVEKYYYDPTFHGLDLDRLFKSASESIDAAQTTNDLFTAIAVPLFRLNDSHTSFLPPSRVARMTHGWVAQMIGDRCFVTAVQPGSDAEAQGLKRGDEILEIEGDRPVRANLDTILWMQRVVAPQTRTALTILQPGGRPETLRIHAKVVTGQAITDLRNTMDINDYMRDVGDDAYFGRHRMVPIKEELLVWKMPGFNMGADEVKTKLLRQVRKYPKLIIDLRGNGGGAVEMLETLVGGLVGPDTKIADWKGRKPRPPMMARKAGDVYEGTILVLVDSFSASASELLARTLQLTGRGTVLGDRTAGAVMVSQTFDHMAGGDRTGVTFATSITVADLIMTDGRSLEHTGVVPDEVILPTAEDLASDRDPVLARALELFGLIATPETAGRMFPMEWGR
jgi:carboxyl-terminal processing protease